jgi:hypothetical protein
MTFDIAGSKSLAARSHLARTASILCGLLFLTSFANVAFAADAKDEILKVLGEAIPRLTNTMASISTGCSGGAGGVPPTNWAGRQQSGNAAIVALSNARVALATSQPLEAVKQQINTGLSHWDKQINDLSKSCSGGSGGQDPVNYGNYARFRDQLKTELETTMRFLPLPGAPTIPPPTQ